MDEVQQKGKQSPVTNKLPQSEEGETTTDQASGPAMSGAGIMTYVRSSLNYSLRSFRDEAEIHAISRALEHTGWNRRRAAQLLSISYRGLLYKIRQHKITPDVRA